MKLKDEITSTVMGLVDAAEDALRVLRGIEGSTPDDIALAALCLESALHLHETAKTIIPDEVIRAAETMLKTSGLPGQRLCAKWILERAEKEGKG